MCPVAAWRTRVRSAVQEANTGMRTYVVLGVRDAPRVVRDEDERVENESHDVVEGLGRAESLVSA